MKLILLTLLIVVVIPFAYGEHNPSHNGGGQPPQACTGNPVPANVTRLSAELVTSNDVRLQWDASLCSTEFQIERQSYVGGNPVGFGTIFTADRDFNLEFISRVPPNDITFFFLDRDVDVTIQHDYRILAKTVTKEALGYSPIVTIEESGISSFLMTGSGFEVLKTSFPIIQIDYIEGSTPTNNLLLDLDNWIRKILYNDLVSMLINWVYAQVSHQTPLWASSFDPVNEAVLFYISPMPSPAFTVHCPHKVEINHNLNQTGQEISITATLLDYPTIIAQETFVVDGSIRHYVDEFYLEQTEIDLISDYSNLFIQLNLQGLAGSPNSAIIQDITLYVPEDQLTCP